MSDVQRFWSHEARNIRCVREADFDRITAERDTLQQHMNVADQRADDLGTQLEALEQRRRAEFEAGQAAERRVEVLEKALNFYAEGEHYHFESGNWDTVSGEPLNILWCGDEPDFIEDGTVARAALNPTTWMCTPCKLEQPTDRSCDVCDGPTTPTIQPQGGPVAMVRTHGSECWEEMTGESLEMCKAQPEEYEVRMLYGRPAEQPAPVPVVPDGYCIMPRQLTAENGAKALLLGEFKLQVTKECPECCELEEPTEGCSICDGEGEYGQKHTIPWDQIKFIYSKAVSGLALKAESVKSR